MSSKEKMNVFKYFNTTILILVSVVIFFGYSYSNRLHLVDVGAMEPDDDIIVTSASVQLEHRLDSSGFTDITYDPASKIKVNITPINGVETAVISTPNGKFYVDIYTMKDYDLDLGLTPKSPGEYPKIKCTSIGQFSSGGIIIEITQVVGAQTYANRIYIKGNKLVDYGFSMKIGQRDETVYYDNVVSIVDTIGGSEHNVVEVYNDSTNEMIYAINTEDVNKATKNVSINYFMCEAVGSNFIAFSTRYYDKNLEYFLDFNDETRKINSVWDYVDASDEEMQRLKHNEEVTSGHSLVFGRRDNENNLVYDIHEIVNDTVVSNVKIPLK